MPDLQNREVRLLTWPRGLPAPGDFEIVETIVPEPAEGQVRVRNRFMSVDPYMRGRLRPGPSYVPSFRIGEPLSGGSVGVIESSRHESFREGDYVLSGMGFREFFLSDGTDLTTVEPEADGVRPSAYLGVMGMPGMTAYVGLLDIGRPKPDDTVFVSAAAGAVGSIVCQIARIKGCRVVGSAGTDAKIEWLRNTVRLDGALNYRGADDLSKELSRLCPKGIDVYFDNVGGDHLQAAISNMNDFGRIVSCGMISQYNNTGPVPGPTNLVSIVSKRLRIEGFIVSDHNNRREQFRRDMAAWLREGAVIWNETVLEGIESAIDGLIGLFSGENLGKMVISL